MLTYNFCHSTPLFPSSPYSKLARLFAAQLSRRICWLLEGQLPVWGDRGWGMEHLLLCRNPSRWKRGLVSYYYPFVLLRIWSWHEVAYFGVCMGSKLILTPDLTLTYLFCSFELVAMLGAVAGPLIGGSFTVSVSWRWCKSIPSLVTLLSSHVL